MCFSAAKVNFILYICSRDTLWCVQGEDKCCLPHLSTCDPQLRTPNQSPIKPKHKNKSFSPELKVQLRLQKTYIYLKKKKKGHLGKGTTPQHRPWNPHFSDNSSIASYLQHIWDPKLEPRTLLHGLLGQRHMWHTGPYSSTYYSMYQHTIYKY